MTGLFMTGASGFLGKRILKNYLQEEIQIFLLVQEKFLPLMKKFLGEEKKTLRAQVHLLKGDITAAGLGLPLQDLPWLRKNVTHVIHAAAAYQLSLSREVGEVVNVEGTRNLLTWMEGLPCLERFGYLSTTAISGTHRGLFRETDFDVGQSFKNFYEATKFEAEKLVRARRTLLPTTIFRPTIVVGDSHTGEIEKIDGPYYGLVMISRHLHLILQRSPHVKCHIEPVDFVTDALCALMKHPEAVNKTVHLADPQPLSYDEFFNLVFKEWGTFRPLLKIPPAWMYPLFFIPGFSKMTGVPRESFVYTMTPVEYGTDTMQALLKETGIRCPTPPEYIAPLLRYFRKLRNRKALQKERW